LKEILTSEPLLKHFDDNKKVFLTIDASISGLGACFEQSNNKNILYPIGYASRKLLDNEKTYSSTTLELYYQGYVLVLHIYENIYGDDNLLYFVIILVSNITKH